MAKNLHVIVNGTDIAKRNLRKITFPSTAASLKILNRKIGDRDNKEYWKREETICTGVSLSSNYRKLSVNRTTARKTTTPININFSDWTNLQLTYIESVDRIEAGTWNENVYLYLQYKVGSGQWTNLITMRDAYLNWGEARNSKSFTADISSITGTGQLRFITWTRGSAADVSTSVSLRINMTDGTIVVS